ncbi:hypothetical protein [Burkholderia phage BCSR129]|nr:hypothetical protein [Burkholderia phage BCSR129]
MKVKNYKILASHSVTNLAEQVNEEIRKGWQPVGSAFVMPHDHGVGQTMVKYVEVSTNLE